MPIMISFSFRGRLDTPQIPIYQLLAYYVETRELNCMDHGATRPEITLVTPFPVQPHNNSLSEDYQIERTCV